MKIIITTIIVLLLVFPLSASENTNKQIDVGFTISNISSTLDPIIKFGNENNKWRISNISLNGSNDKRDNLVNLFKSDDNSFRGGIGIGREYYKQITNYMNIIWGGDFIFKYYRNREAMEDIDEPLPITIRTTEYSNNYTAKFNAVLGMNWIIKNQYIINLEYRPYISYAYAENYYGIDGVSIDLEETNSDFGYNVMPRLTLTFCYRF